MTEVLNKETELLGEIPVPKNDYKENVSDIILLREIKYLANKDLKLEK